MRHEVTLPNQQLLIDLPAAAKALSLSEKTTWKLARSGRLPSLKVGARRLFSIVALQHWIAVQAESQGEGSA